MNKHLSLLIIGLWAAWLSGLLVSVQAAELYHTNRTFTAIEFNIQGTPTADQLNKEAKKLTDIVPGAPIKITSTNAIERQIVVGLGYDSGTSAWNAAKNYSYSAPTRQYPGKMFDNAGWVRGIRSVGANWGAFIWTIQNQIVFKSSETNRWAFGGGLVAITNVIVGSLGNYPPMTDVADTGPDLSRAFNTYPGDNQGDEGNYRFDLTTYYQLAIPDILVMPREAVTAVGGSSVRFTATGTNIPSGVTWTINPSGVTSGAVIQTVGYSADVTPGTVPNIYQICAISVDCPNLYDEAKLTVLKVESIQPDNISNLIEFEDGDENPNTRVFLVPIAQAMDFPVVPVTVRATLNPNLSESQVPAGMTLEGGIGSEKLTRTVNRSVAAGPSKTEFTFNYGGSDSGFKTTIYVYNAKVGLFADNGGENSPEVGHSWGRYTIDENTRELIVPTYRSYLREIGFFPVTNAGYARNPI